VFLTQDTEFEDLAADTRATVIISRVPQHLRIADRVELWANTIDAFVAQAPPGKVFDLLSDGSLVALTEP